MLYYTVLCILIKYNFLLFFFFFLLFSNHHFLLLATFFRLCSSFPVPKCSTPQFFSFLVCILFTTHFVIVSFLLLQQSLIDCSFYRPYNHLQLLAHFIFLKGHAFQNLDYCALKPGFLFLFICNKGIVYFDLNYLCLTKQKQKNYSFKLCNPSTKQKIFLAHLNFSFTLSR